MILSTLFRFAFASTSWLYHLISHHIVTRRPVLQKVRDHTRMVLSLLVSLRFQVLFHSPPGVLFTFPSRYFSLSVTWSYLAFWDGPHFFRQDFSCPDVLRILLASSRFRLRDFHPLWYTFPGISTIHSTTPCSPYPKLIINLVWAPPISLATTFGITFVFFSSGYLDVSVPRVPLAYLSIQYAITRYYSCWVPSFGYPRISRYLLLPVAFRSLSRPSSAPCT